MKKTNHLNNLPYYINRCLYLLTFCLVFFLTEIYESVYLEREVEISLRMVNKRKFRVIAADAA